MAMSCNRWRDPGITTVGSSELWTMEAGTARRAPALAAEPVTLKAVTLAGLTLEGLRCRNACYLQTPVHCQSRLSAVVTARVRAAAFPFCWEYTKNLFLARISVAARTNPRELSLGFS